jgi:hypothetical protein
MLTFCRAKGLSRIAVLSAVVTGLFSSICPALIGE